MTVQIKNICVFEQFDKLKAQGHLPQILHVCNAQGVMGSGIAKSIKERFPDAYREYLTAHKLGAITFTTDIINMVAQEFYGNDNRRYLNYGALGNCLARVESYVGSGKFREDYSVKNIILIPHNMGCDRAGGDWTIVLEMITWYFRPHEVIICKKP